MGKRVGLRFSRREFLGMAGAAGALLGEAAVARGQLCAPDNDPNYLSARFPGPPTPASPPTTPFIVPLPIPPPIRPGARLDPPPNPSQFQLFEEFRPRKFYELHAVSFKHSFHPDLGPSTVFGWASGPGVRKGEMGAGSHGRSEDEGHSPLSPITPGPTFFARYGEPILVRIYNDLPPDHVGFGIPSITVHNHNAHTASESDGFPGDFHGPGTFHDHHYANFPAGFDPREKLGTLWYHDHRMGFTAQNIARGLVGFYLLFDEQDSGNENDDRPGAFRLPSGEFDIPMVFQDRMFNQDGEMVYDIFDTDGVLGDKYTVNGAIQPFLQVRPRKYRFRMLDAGPSRFYDLALSNGQPFIQIASDGNLLPQPVKVQSVTLGPAERVDVIVDFSNLRRGDKVYLVNRMQQFSGRGPTGKILPLNHSDLVMRFDVVSDDTSDPSQVPERMRELPTIDLSEVVRERLWKFDYIGGTWVINDKTFDPNRSDAQVKMNTAEIWTFRSEGENWAHPIHVHLEEYQVLSYNGKKPKLGSGYFGRKDVVRLNAGDEIKIFMRFRDFHGRYPLHCHNAVHEDHAMMIRWDVVPD